VLGLTAHSDVLRHLEGRQRRGRHPRPRGGASLEDPLGSAASHGCIRLADRSIDWLVRTVGRQNLAGIPVSVRRPTRWLSRGELVFSACLPLPPAGQGPGDLSDPDRTAA
jgi:hypothetical protein